MTEADLNEVAAIEEASFVTPWSRDLFEKELGNRFSRNLVAKIDGEIAGYIVFWEVAEEIHLLDLAVAGAFRRRGIARELFSRLLRCAKDLDSKRVFLEVRTENPEAKGLYKSLGFTEIGIRKRYYSDGGDATVMALELSL